MKTRYLSIDATVEAWSACGLGGWRIVFYTDDDNGSGYGDNPRVAYWYADSQIACHRKIKSGYAPLDSEFSELAA